MILRLINDMNQDEPFSDEVYERLYSKSTDDVYINDDDDKVITLISRIMHAIVQP